MSFHQDRLMSRLASIIAFACAALATACGQSAPSGGSSDGPPLTVEGQAARQDAPPAPPPAPAKADTAATAPTPPPAPQGPAATIVGSWAAAPESCNSGEAINFTADAFYTEGSDGSWQLSGDTLTIRTVEADTGGMGPAEGGGSAEETNSPVETNLTLIEASPTRLVWRELSGETQTFVRCR